MLIYIIGKITGNPDYREQFARAEEALCREYSCDIINPAKRGNLSQADYARLSYNAVTKADAVACLWTTCDSFGATMEWHIANGQGKRMMSVDENYNATEAELSVASAAAYAAADAAYGAAYDAARADANADADHVAAYYAAYAAAYSGGDTVRIAAADAAKSAQVKMIAELGNPFKKES